MCPLLKLCQRGFLSTLSLRRATFFTQTICVDISNFYPRSPCGERLMISALRVPVVKFLSTLSLRRATMPVQARSQSPVFLSTLSLRRATRAKTCHFRHHSHFYPRSPCGERPITRCPSGVEESFLSTLSLRRATTRWRQINR